MHRAPSADQARRLTEAVGPDQQGFVRAVRRGRVVTFVIEAESAGSARATADDLLACLTAADRATTLAPSKSPRRRSGNAPER
ncbi:MAG TPA: KEOPS complex subunit Pcc1 [Thermoplasmata archaeon]|nr:KEOPS complex subunit Pcc1 [Thermoplasmata archaeon]